MTHEEILQLRRENALFRCTFDKGLFWYTLVAVSVNKIGFFQYTLAGVGEFRTLSYSSFIEDVEYSKDDGKTWRKLERKGKNA